MQRRTSSDEMSDVFTSLESSEGNMRTLKEQKPVRKNENLTPENVEGLYEVNTTNWEKTMTPGNAEEKTQTINWSSFFPAIAGQKVAANPAPPPRKPFGTLPTRPYRNSLPTAGRPTITVGGMRYRKSRKSRSKSRKSRSKNTRKYRR